MALRDTSLLWKIIFLIQIIGFILGLIAFGTNYLASGIGEQETDHSRVELNIGLWKFCKNGQCIPTSDVLHERGRSTAWLNASKVMMGLALIGEFIAIVLTSLAFRLTLSKPVGVGTVVVLGVSVLFGVIGVAVAGGESTRIFNDINGSPFFDVAWSFTMFMVIQLIFLVTGGLHLLDLRSKHSNQLRTDHL